MTTNDAQTNQVQHLPASAGEAIWSMGNTFTLKATSETTNGALLLLEASIPPQGGPPLHVHRVTDEAFWVLEGELEILGSDHSFVAGAGSFVFIPKGAAHGFRNVGTGTARFVGLALPGGLEGYFREVGLPAGEGKAPPPTPLEAEKGLAAGPRYDTEYLSAENTEQAAGADTPRVVHVPAGEGEALWTVGDTYTYKATSETTNGALFFMEASVPPQGGPPPHRQPNMDEAFYVLEGEVEVRGSDRSFTARVGSFVFIPRSAPHAFRNVGTRPMTMLVLAVPGGLEQFLRAAGQPAGEGAAPPVPPMTPEDAERAAAVAASFDVELFPQGMDRG